MRLDRKLLLIAPTIVLVFVIGGMLFAAIELHVLSSVSATFQQRSAFVAAVERGDKHISVPQAIGMLHYAFEVETRRTSAIVAARDLLIVLSAIGLAACITLALGIRAVPREHWPRLSLGRRTESP